MNDNHVHLHQTEPLPQALPVCPEPGKAVVSPLGWSIRGRLICAASAAALLWLSVAWANGWLN